MKKFRVVFFGIPGQPDLGADGCIDFEIFEARNIMSATKKAADKIGNFAGVLRLEVKELINPNE